MSQSSSSSDKDINIPRDAFSHAASPTTIPATSNVTPEPKASSRGRTPAGSSQRSPRCRGQPSPAPTRSLFSSKASSFHSATPTIPPIGKWTVAGLRQALGNSDIQASRKINKAELYDLYVSLQVTPKMTHGQSKAHRAQDLPVQPPPLSAHSEHGSLRQSSHSNRAPASLDHAPVFTMTGPFPPLDKTQPSAIASAAAAPQMVGPSVLPLAAQFHNPHNPFLFQWPSAPVTDTSAKLLQLAAQANPCQQSLYPLGYNPAHIQRHATLPSQTGVGLPPFAAQAHTSSFYPSHLPTNCHFQTTTGHPSTMLPTTFAAPNYTLPSSSAQTKSPYSLFTATPLPVASNAVAMEPPPVSKNIRALILSEIQDAGSRGGQIPNFSTSLFATDIPITHPLKPSSMHRSTPSSEQCLPGPSNLT